MIIKLTDDVFRIIIRSSGLQEAWKPLKGADCMGCKGWLREAGFHGDLGHRLGQSWESWVHVIGYFDSHQFSTL